VPDLEKSILPRPLHTVFNRKMPEGRYITSVSEFQPLPGVHQAIAKLNRAGLRVIVVSNQRGIALGLYTAADVLNIHAAFQQELNSLGANVDAFYFCPHDKAHCNCRKPLPGLFQQAHADFPDIAGESSAIVGDSWSDIEFGRRLGMLTIFIESNSENRKPGAESACESADLSFPALSEAADALIALLVPA
jgi:D-glycero-D-manno-heptose 1,7-bisphosphate phosphatase